MIVSLYHAIRTFQDLPTDILFERMEELKPGLFDPLLTLGEAEAKWALLFIAHAYSKESDLVVMGERDGNAKLRIAKYVDMPDYMHGDVVMLQHPVVLDVVLNYLEYQSDRKWQHLQQNRMLYETMNASILKLPKKEDGAVDFKTVIEASKLRDALLKSIEAQEKEYTEQYGFVVEGRDEIKKIKKATKDTGSLSVESSEFIK